MSSANLNDSAFTHRVELALGDTRGASTMERQKAKVQIHDVRPIYARLCSVNSVVSRTNVSKRRVWKSKMSKMPKRRDEVRSGGILSKLEGHRSQPFCVL